MGDAKEGRQEVTPGMKDTDAGHAGLGGQNSW